MHLASRSIACHNGVLSPDVLPCMTGIVAQAVTMGRCSRPYAHRRRYHRSGAPRWPHHHRYLRCRQADTVQWARCLSLLACNAVCGVWRRVGPGRTDFRGTQYPLRWCTALSIQRAGLAQEERSIETRIWQVHPLGSSGARKSWARSRACCQAVSLDSTAPRVAGGTPAGTTLHASRSSSRQSSARGRIPNNSSTAAA